MKPARQVALVGIMAATMECGKLALSFLPNIEIVTLLHALYGYAFGALGIVRRASTRVFARLPPDVEKIASLIREKACASLKTDLSACKLQLPKHFSVKLTYKEHVVASEMSYFPGAFRVDSHTVGFEEDNILEVARKLKFMF